MLAAQRTSTPQASLFDPIGQSAAGGTTGLDPEQLAAATAGGGGVVVRAGAGTGKTRTLVARISHLVETLDVAPETIVVATFTNKAAKEIRSRVAATIGKDRAARLRMGTFHSLGARFLRKHHASVGLSPRFAILDDDGARARLHEAVKDSGFVKAENVAALADAAFPTIRLWKAWGLTPEAIERSDRPRRSDEEERHAKVYVAYQAHLAKNDLVDFADLVLLPVTAMKDNKDGILDIESETVAHMLVDEAQDANPTQVLFARCLSSVHRNVFAVGDEDQSIFSFQGGYPEAIQQIAGVGAVEHALVRNRRCTDQILEPAVKLVGWNRRKVPKRLESGVDGARPTIDVTSSEREEAFKVAKRIKSLISAGSRPDEIAVLGRSAYVFAPVEEAFLKEEIPYEVIGAGGFVEREEVRDLLAFFMLAKSPSDSHSFQRIVNKPLRGLGQTALNSILASQNPDEEFHNVIATPARVGLAGAAAKSAIALSEVLSDLSDAYERELPTEFLLDIVLSPQGIGYEAHLLAKKEGKSMQLRRAESLVALRRLAQEEPSIDAFMERVALAQDDDVLGEGGRVRISTMHSSKGLEWDHVFCVAMDANVIPSPRALDQGKQGKPGDPWNGPRGGGMEEERRLAHVAFTRARKTLSVYAPLTRNGKGTLPSPFLPEADLDPYDSMDPFAVKGGIGKKGLSGERAGRKGFSRR